MSEPLKVGIVGLGFGARAHIQGFRRAGARVTAVCAASPLSARSAAEGHGVPFWTTDVGELVGRADVELVSIASPPHLHRAHVMAALSAGKHVLCEKPLALDLGEAIEMLRAAEGAGVIHAVDHEFRYLSTRLALRRLIADGVLGELRSIEVLDATSWMSDPMQPRPGWWLSAELGGGVLGANGSHLIDAIRQVTGTEVATVSAHLRTTMPQRSALGGGRTPMTSDDTVTAWLVLRGGVPVTLHINCVAATEWRRISVFGSTATASLEGNAVAGTLRLSSPMGGVRIVARDDRGTRGAASAAVPPYYLRAFAALIRRIRTAVRSGGSPSAANGSYPTFRDGALVQAVLDAARRSALSGHAVAVNDDDVPRLQQPSR